MLLVPSCVSLCFPFLWLSVPFSFPVSFVVSLLRLFLSNSVFCVSPCSLWSSSQFSASFTSGGFSLLTLLLFSSVLQVLLGNPSVVRVLLPCVSAGFLSYSCHSLLWVLPCPSGCLALLSWLFLLVLVVVFFAPVLVLSLPGLPCSVAVAFGCLFSDSFESPVPVATWSPFGTSPDSFGLCLLGSWCLSLLVAFTVLSPLRSSALFASGVLFVLCSPDGFSWFFLVFGLLRCWFFPGMFLVPTRAGSFRPFFFTLSSSVSGCLHFGVLPLGRVPGSYRYFRFFLCQRLFHSFCVLFGRCAYFLSSRPSLGFVILSSSGSSLGLLCPAFGFWPLSYFGFL